MLGMKDDVTIINLVSYICSLLPVEQGGEWCKRNEWNFGSAFVGTAGIGKNKHFHSHDRLWWCRGTWKAWELVCSCSSNVNEPTSGLIQITTLRCTRVESGTFFPSRNIIQAFQRIVFPI
jgi:hypothetical protein